jgi:two-component system nitrate/nitrite response regulator NarL
MRPVLQSGYALPTPSGSAVLTASQDQDQSAGRLLSPRVLVASRDSATRNGIRIALEDDGIDVCGQVGNVQELLDGVTRLEPNLCLVDVDLPGGGILAAAELHAYRQPPALVLLASKIDDDEFLRAMRLGAVGYLSKGIAPKRLPAVIRAVLLGEPAIPRTLVGLLLNGLRNSDSRKHLAVPNGPVVDLTSREWEVLEFMRDGLSTREIAARLVIAEVTVRRHIGTMLKKLRVQTRREALDLLRSA